MIFFSFFYVLCGFMFKTNQTNTKLINVEFTTGDYIIENITIDNKIFSRIIYPDGVPSLEEGKPELPSISRSVIIPDDGLMETRIINIEAETINVNTIIPSKGNLKRNVIPDTIPYVFDKIYNEDKFYPDVIIEKSKEFILRDFRGITIKFNPFIYNPKKNRLIIVKKVVVQIYEKGKGGENILNRKNLKISRDFSEIYKNFFINYENTLKIYPFLFDTLGKMLIITADVFYDNFNDFINWKMKKGIEVEICSVSTIGNNSTAIKSKIQNKYNNDGVTWILLVGEANLVSTIAGSYDETCDPTYGYLSGSDNYPDAFISRFSGISETQIDNQILRVLNYERNPPQGLSWDWYHKGLLTASNEGSPADSTRANWLKDTLLSYTYTEITKVYEPWGTDAMITNALNNGRSILNHIGHGSETGFGTNTAFWFDVNDVNNLNNTNMLPFLYLCACLSGDFDAVATCCAEAWMWAGTPSAPKGAIGVYASSVLQSWVPPTVSQNHAMGLLKREKTTTIGGLCFNGSMYMYEQTGDLEMLETWHIFGDASLDLRTDSPDTLLVEHSSFVIPSPNTFSVNVKDNDGITPIKDAIVCLYIPNQEPILHIAGYTDINGNIEFNISPLNVGDTMWVTVTKHNYRPYEGYAIVLDVGMPSKPEIIKPFNYAKLKEKNPTISLYSEDPQDDDIVYCIYYDTLYNFSTAESIVTANYQSKDTIDVTFPSAMINNKTYWFKVKCKDPNGSNIWTQFSNTQSFTIDTTLAQGTCSWFMQKKEQFFSCILSGTEIQGDSVILLPFGDTIIDTLVFENFENGNLPQNWTIINGNSDSYQWSIGTTGDIGSYTPPNYGTKYAYYLDDDAGNGVINYNEEIITSPIYVGNLQGKLEVVYSYGFRLYQNGEKFRFKMRKKTGGVWGNWQDKIVYIASSSGEERIDIMNELPCDSIMFSWFYSDSTASSHWGYACAFDNFGLINTYQLQNNYGSIVSPEIKFSDLSKTFQRNLWGDIIFTKSSPSDSIGLQVEYYNGSGWELIPDNLVTGNSSGIFTNEISGRISLSNINDTLTYGRIRIKASFYRGTKSSGEPRLLSWEVGNLNNYVGLDEENDERYCYFSISSNLAKNEFMFSFIFPSHSNPTLKIFDINGRIVKEFDQKTLMCSKEIHWKGENNTGKILPSGIYFIKAEVDKYRKIEKIIFLR
uniref:T9SS type A sorting domain-containing protein n=1 Tax=candidate division WOR-3 bacterium TaxID=2052148 RepID=A0A7C4Y631_UNCW3